MVNFFEKLCDNLIIEFIPKEDSQVKRLLATREDIFDDYNESKFVEEFEKKFEIIRFENIHETKRTLYSMKNKKIED